VTSDIEVTGVVLSGTGGVWRVRTERGDTIDVSLRGRLKKSDAGRRADGSLRRDTVASRAGTLKLAVGDDVRLERSERGDDWAIAEILPRRSKLARRAPGGGQGERIVAANVDQVVVVFAAANPEPHTRMLDRFLIIAEGNDLAARIIINKVDLVGEAAVRARFAPYERAGYTVEYTSTKAGIGLDSVRELLAGRRSVLSGPSGVGKSSLLNAIFPGADLRVGAISESVNKGRHTTVGALMLPLPDDVGGYVIDTPGLREVGLWDVPVERLDGFFPEIRALRADCRFADCRHVAEPECAVREAVRRGEVSEERYDSYRRLRDELEAAR
jgi:ribosome biogenesis GTPase / thiamine phosphate phosphatase